MTTTRAPGTHDLTTRRVKLSTLRPHPRNARNGDVEAVAESLTVNGQYRPIVVTTDGTILAGNHTYAAALSLGWDRISVVTVDVAPESPEALRIMLADNRTADLGGYDDALLLELLRDLDSLDGSGYVEDDVAELELLTATQAGADLNLGAYTDVVNVPQYEPSGPPPAVSELIDTSKTDALIARIDATPDLPEPVAAYLRAAAARHTVFNYRLAAEFYPHATAEVQALMEDSALVIIDVQDAIRGGYVRLAGALDALQAADVDAMGWDSDGS